MADSKVSALTATTSLADTDLLYVSSSGADKKITGADLKASVIASLGLDDLSDATITSAAAGHTMIYDGNAAQWINSVPLAALLKPSAAKFEAFPRILAGNNSMSITGGTIYVTPIALPNGAVVSSITFCSGSTALSGGTHQYFGLMNSSLTLLCQSADATSTAWGSQAAKTLAMTSPYTVTASGVYYALLLVTASTTLPTIASISLGSHVGSLAPILYGTVGTSKTDLSSLGSIVGANQVPYCYVS